MKTYSLSEQVVNEIIQYLGMQPYREVVAIISHIDMDLKNQPEIPTGEEEKEDKK